LDPSLVNIFKTQSTGRQKRLKAEPYDHTSTRDTSCARLEVVKPRGLLASEFLSHEISSSLTLFSYFSCRKVMEPLRSNDRSSQRRAPSSREIRRQIEELGLPEGLEKLVYEFIVYIPETREELIQSIKAYCKDASGFPPINSWDVTKITNFNGLFANCYTFNESIGGWNVSQVTTMRWLFSDCRNFNQNLADWNVSQVITMMCLFDGCSTFNQCLSKWDVSRVTNLTGMFFGCRKFNQRLADWDVSRVTDISYMFHGCHDFNRSLARWDVSRVKDMCYMFCDCHKFNQNLVDWDVSQVTDMKRMFSGCHSFKQSLAGWNAAKVEDAARYVPGLKEM